MKRWARLVGIGAAGLLWAAAAQAAGSQTLTISPAIIQPTLEPGQLEASFPVSVTNHTAAAQTLQLEVIDFGELSQTGGLFLSNQPSDFERKYGLASWMTLSQSTLNLAPGASQTITATITDQATLSPGGHYAAIVFTPAVGLGGGKSAQVGVQPELTTLVFATKEAGAIFHLALSGYTRPSSTRLPSQITLRFHNTGNVHVVPRGVVEITDPTGHTVAQGIINEDSTIILPGTVRTYAVALTGQRLSLLPGHYHLVILYRYDGNDTYAAVEYNFWFINVPALVTVVVLVAIAIWGSRKLWRRRRPRRRPAS